MIPAALPCMRVRTDGLIFLDKKTNDAPNAVMA